jgi:hypothetical protein
MVDIIIFRSVRLYARNYKRLEHFCFHNKKIEWWIYMRGHKCKISFVCMERKVSQSRLSYVFLQTIRLTLIRIVCTTSTIALIHTGLYYSTMFCFATV